MNVPEVTIISLGYPPRLIEKPNKNTLTLLSILLNSRYFNDFIDTFIKKHDIEQEEIRPLFTRLNKQFSTIFRVGIEDVYKELEVLRKIWEKECRLEEIIEIVKNLGLHSNFVLDIYLLTKYKAFRELENYPKIDYHPSKWYLKVNIDENVRSEKEFSGLIFNHQMSKVDIYKWIDENWENLESSMKANLTVSPIIKTDFKDIELASELYDLYKQGNKPSKILEIVSEKYIKDIDIYDSLSLEFIKNKIKRFKKLILEKEKYLKPTEIIYDTSQ